MWIVVAYFLSLLGLLWVMIQEMRAADWRMSPLTMAVGALAVVPAINTLLLAAVIVLAWTRRRE